MADLDDFFAKKDKKKKTKKGFSKANTEVLAKNLEENDRRERESNDDKSVPLATSEAVAKYAREENGDPLLNSSSSSTALDKATSGTSGGQKASVSTGTSTTTSDKNSLLQDGQGDSMYFGVLNKTNDDEWLDYSNQKKDYSNLKIDVLKIDDESKDDDDHEVNEDGEKVRTKRAEAGPWSKKIAQGKEENDEEDDDEEEKNEEAESEANEKSQPTPESNSSGPKSYVPPHLRGQQTATAPSRPSRRNKEAPDITSEVYFPSLSAAANPNDTRLLTKGAKDDFEEVRSGGAQVNVKNSEGPKLTLGNKFAALGKN